MREKHGVVVQMMKKLRRIAEQKLSARAVYQRVREGAKDMDTIMKMKGKLTKRDVELGLQLLVGKKSTQIDKNGRITSTQLSPFTVEQSC
ncbi:MAG: hypothetical protein QXV32_02055 [Conexivisphaerales archaeon]